MDIILENIFSALKNKGKMQKDLTDFLGISPQATTNWKNGHSQSYMQRLPQIAQYLGVSVEDLTGSAPVISDLSAQEKTILTIFRSVSEEGRMRIVQAIMNIKDLEEEKSRDEVAG